MSTDAPADFVQAVTEMRELQRAWFGGVDHLLADLKRGQGSLFQ